MFVFVCVCVSREIKSYHNLSTSRYKVSCLSLMFVTREKKNDGTRRRSRSIQSVMYAYAGTPMCVCVCIEMIIPRKREAG